VSQGSKGILRPGSVILAVVFTAAVAGPVFGATQTFKDDAGRIIYTVDDDGTVSMFENSPTDLTMSVTRGSREQMQPRITEVLPESVQSGTSAVLRLKGKNLVGAQVKVGASGVDIGAYSAKPRSLDIPIMLSSDVRPGPLALTISTPIGHTQLTLKVVEPQIGGNPKPESSGDKKIMTTAPSSCPEGMVGVSAELGGFCIEIDRSFTGDYTAAEKACAKAGRRLCSALEWQHACEQSKALALPLKNMTGAWEWTGSWDPYQYDPDLFAMDLTPDIKNFLMGKEDCQKKLSSPRWRAQVFPGRCCK
jgi:hypothetical protein